MANKLYTMFVRTHSHPITQILHLASFAVGIYGLWMRDWNWITAAIVIMFVGHLFKAEEQEEAKEEKEAVKKKK